MGEIPNQNNDKPKVLSIGFNRAAMQQVDGQLRQDYDVSQATCGTQAKKILAASEPEAIIMDIRTPDKIEGGYDLIQGMALLNHITGSTEIPVIAVTPSIDIFLERMIRKAGAYEVIYNITSDGIDDLILGDKMRHAIIHNRAPIDEMTGLYRKTQFEERVAIAFNQLQRLPGKKENNVPERRETEPHLSLIYFDLDGFKEVNDRIGHEVGDNVIMKVGNIFRQIRNYEIAGRLGGDEFAVMLYANLGGAFEVGKRICESINGFDFTKYLKTEMQVNIAISAGVATHPSSYNMETSKDLIARAERLMKRAKAEKKKGNVQDTAIYGQIADHGAYRL